MQLGIEIVSQVGLRKMDEEFTVFVMEVIGHK